MGVPLLATSEDRQEKMTPPVEVSLLDLYTAYVRFLGFFGGDMESIKPKSAGELSPPFLRETPPSL